MDQTAQLIELLGLQEFSPEEQQTIIENYQMEVGEGLTEGLTEAQLQEYQQIIDGNQQVISDWLEQNQPEYRESTAFQELSEGYDEDPEKVPADKVYASIAWVQLNATDMEGTVARIQAEVKANPAQYL